MWKLGSRRRQSIFLCIQRETFIRQSCWGKGEKTSSGNVEAQNSLVYITDEKLGPSYRGLGQTWRRPHDPECRTSADAGDTDDDADEACLPGSEARCIDCLRGGRQLVFCLRRSPLCCRLGELDRWLMVCNTSLVRQKVGSLSRRVSLHNSDPGLLILVHRNLSAVPLLSAGRPADC